MTDRSTMEDPAQPPLTADLTTGEPPLTADPGAPPADPRWGSFDLDGLRSRLVEIKDLLEQAAAVGIAQDADRLEALTRLAQRSREDGNAPPGRRRYR